MRRSTTLLLVILAVAATYLLVRNPGSRGRPEAAGPGVRETVRVGQAGTLDWDSVRAMRAAVRRRIAESDTYLPLMLAEGDSLLRRWPERVAEPIAVYLPEGGAAGYSVAMGQAVEEAFSRWQRGSRIPVQFRIVRDPANAEVSVQWIEKFDSRRTGQADLTWNTAGWVLKGTLTLATHSHNGWPLPADAVYTVALHEIGHLLGLGHSDQPEDVMYPTTSVHDLTNRDRRTAGLLYALPPGSVKEPRARR
jgi:hypothetical protein